jgi:ring-1,2-phenylacetyl-CoA epoxidase subunit PaaC
VTANVSQPTGSVVEVSPADRYDYLIRLGDDSLILSHRVAEWCSWAPQLEEDMALVNISLDLLGQTRLLYTYAGTLTDEPKTEDDLAYLREEPDFRCIDLVEHPTVHHYGRLTAQLFLYCAYAVPLWRRLTASTDAALAEIAAKSLKEARYHLEHSAGWVIRLGDGTEESHAKLVEAFDLLWPLAEDLFQTDALTDKIVAAGIGPDPKELAVEWRATVEEVFAEATLAIPTVKFRAGKGRSGVHSEYLGYALAEMQYIHRLHPGAQW